MKEILTEWFTHGSVGSWMLPTFQFTDALDIFLVAVLFYEILRWVRKTKAWVLIKGIIIVLVIWLLASVMELNMAIWILESTLSVGILAVVIIFQPELRRALEQLGQGNFFTRFFGEEKEVKAVITEEAVENIVQSMLAMSAVKTGALIAVEQTVQLDEYEQTGLPVDANITSQLIINIFEKNTPLHDGAVIVRGNRITSATCYLPLSDNLGLSKDLGTRHRAGVGISEVSDSLTIIVSEETGKISVAYDGKLSRNLDGEQLKTRMHQILNKSNEENVKGIRKWKGRSRERNAKKTI